MKRRIVAYILPIISGVVVVLVISVFWGKIIRILTPVFMAIIIYHIVKPFIIKMEKLRIKRSFGIIIIYLGLLLLLALTVVLFLPALLRNAKELSDLLPDMIRDYNEFLNRAKNYLLATGWGSDFAAGLINEAGQVAISLKNIAADLLEGLGSGVAGIAKALLNFVLALILVFHFLRDKVKFSNAMLSLIPQKSRNAIITTGREVNIILSNFIRGQLTAAVIVGIMEIIGLSLAGVKYALIFGVIGGVANFIPYFGPFIGAIPAVAVTMLESPLRALLVAGIFFVVQQIDNTFISPKIIEGRLGLHPVATILAVYAGGEVAGVGGMLFAVPLVAIIRVLFRRVVEEIAS